MSNSYSLQVAADFADSGYEENMSIYIFILEEGECQMVLENKRLDKKEKTPDLAWLDDPEVFRVGQLKAHSDHHFLTERKRIRNRRKVCVSVSMEPGSLHGRRILQGVRRIFTGKMQMYPDLGRSRCQDIWNWLVLTGFTISIPCIHGRVMSIEDRPKPDLESKRGSFLRRSIIR